jgi:signal transduction histidine kinase/CheY-like chemotaxis protein/HPt (histidine-containing phosphotransfer) domain-containing protein
MELALISLLVVIIMIMVFLFWRLSQKQRENQQEKQQISEELERVRNSLTEQERFLAYTSHELRTPLNAIAGGSVLLSKTNLDERQRKYVNTIQSSVDATLLIVNDILDLSKIDSNMVEVRPVEFMITEVLNGIKHILRYRAESKGIEFEVEFADEIPAVIKGDSKHLNQILLNLSTNAVKFTDIGKVTIRISKISETDTHLTLKFDVEDTGKGIRKSNLPTIFNQYEQETRHTIKHEGGTGLGLAITKKLVELQQGTISVESQYLKGTTFTVIITYEKVDQSRVVSKEQSAEQFEKIGDVKILIVDDNAINREILHDLLLDANPNIQMVMAENGEVAVAKMYNNAFDLVLLDIQMPKKNGYETAEHIRKNMKYPVSETPIIAMTAHALENVAESCFKAGMNDYISKPIDMAYLANKMNKLLEKRRKTVETLNKYKTIDLEHLKELTKDNKDRILKYIGIFLQNLPDELDVLKKHAARKDFTAIRESLHKLKGITAYMGIKKLTALFNSPEYSKLEEMNEEKFKDFFTEIENSCNKAIEELTEVQKQL